MEREWNIGRHGQHVKSGQPCQNAVNWSAHVFASENRDVDQVHRNAEQTDQQTEVAMHPCIPHVERLKSVILERAFSLHIQSHNSAVVIAKGLACISVVSSQ